MASGIWEEASIVCLGGRLQGSSLGAFLGGRVAWFRGLGFDAVRLGVQDLGLRDLGFEVEEVMGRGIWC